MSWFYRQPPHKQSRPRPRLIPSGGPQTYQKTGSLIVDNCIASGADTFNPIETGKVIGALSPSGSDIFNPNKAGKLIESQPANVTRETYSAPSGFDTPHVLLAVDDKLFMFHRQVPVKVTRFNSPLTDLTDVTTAAWPNDLNHESADDTVYVHMTRLFYTVFRDTAGEGKIRIGTTDPATLTLTDFIVYLFDPVDMDVGRPEICTDGVNLYVTTAGNGTDCSVVKFSATTGQFLGSRAVSSGYLRSHTCQYDGETDRIYVGGFKSPAGSNRPWAGWCAADLSASNAVDTGTTATLTDDSAITTDSYWLGFESTPNNLIQKISKDLGTITNVTIPSGSGGLFFFDSYIWSATETTPGTIYKIDPNTGSIVQTINLLSGEDTSNELEMLQGVMFATCFLTPCKVVRLVPNRNGLTGADVFTPSETGAIVNGNSILSGADVDTYNKTGAIRIDQFTVGKLDDFEVITQDDFERPDSPGTLGANWTQIDSSTPHTMSIASGNATPDQTSSSQAWNVQTYLSPFVKIEITATSSNTFELYARQVLVSGQYRGYYAFMTNSRSFAIGINHGSLTFGTALATVTTGTFHAGDAMAFHVHDVSGGVQLDIWVRRSGIWSITLSFLDSSNTFTAAGLVGIGGNNTSITIAEFGATEIPSLSRVQKVVIFSETGSYISAFAASAADSFNPSETGAIINGNSILSGADVSNPNEVGSIISDLDLAGVESVVSAGNAKDGLLQSDFIMVGADVFTSIETGKIISDNSIISGADVFSPAEAGNVIVNNSVLSGADVDTYNRTGTIESDNTTLSGADSFNPTETGNIIVNNSVLAGADVFSSAETGKVVSDNLIISGADEFGSSETGKIISDLSLDGSDASVFSESGKTISDLSLLAADAVTYAEMSSLISDLILSGSKLVQFTESGAIVSDSDVAGISNKEVAGKEGSIISQFVPSGADVFAASETGKIISDLILSGQDVAVMAETGKLVSAFDLTGLDVDLYSRNGTIISDLDASGSRQNQVPKTGSIISLKLLSGNDVFTPTKSGSIITALILNGSTVKQASKTAHIVSKIFPSAFDVATFNRSATLISPVVVSGSDATEFVETGMLQLELALSGTNFSFLLTLIELGIVSAYTLFLVTAYNTYEIVDYPVYRTRQEFKEFEIVSSRKTVTND